MSMSQDGSRVAEIAPENLTAEQSAIVEAAKKGRGFLPKPFLVWLHSPDLAERMESLGTFLNTRSSLSDRELEIAVVVVTRRLSSAFPLDAHLRAAARAGHPPAVIDALREGRVPEFATERERVVYEIARTSDDSEPASDELFDRAVRAIGRNGLADLLALIGYYTAVSVAMKLHRVPAPA
jgi:4-carboxymuconolactone decarboxylase